MATISFYLSLQNQYVPKLLFVCLTTFENIKDLQRPYQEANVDIHRYFVLSRRPVYVLIALRTSLCPTLNYLRRIIYVCFLFGYRRFADAFCPVQFQLGKFFNIYEHDAATFYKNLFTNRVILLCCMKRKELASFTGNEIYFYRNR